MIYYSLKEIADHVGVSAETVRDTCKLLKVKTERLPSVRGYRVAAVTANALIAKKWSKAGPLPVNF